MSNKETKPIKLSNEGLMGFYETVRPYEASIFRSKIDNTIKFTITDAKESLRIIKDPDEFKNYISKLMKVFKNNKIQGKDKVFFSSNSLYPRTSFNRYSNEARRIENPDKADKIVVGNSLDIGYMYLRIGLQLKDKLINFINVHYLKDQIDDLIKVYDKSKGVCDLTEAFLKESKNYYGYSYDAASRLDKALVKQFLNQFKDSRLIKYTEMTGTTKKSQGTLDILSKGYPLTSFITDIEVSRYIDSFKDTITAESYPMLLSALSGDDKQVTLAMKLIENMDNTKSLPYLYALFINAVGKNRANIMGNKTYRSVGFNNVLKNFDIKTLISRHDPYSRYANSQGRLSYISNTYTKRLKTNEDKEVFLSLVNDEIEKELKNIVGANAYNTFVKRKEVKDEE